MDKEKLKIEVKKLLTKFETDLKDISLENNYENIQKTCFREDENSIDYLKIDSSFRSNFLKNAKNSNQDFILSEIGDWEK
jgi:hypothetical protein